MIEAHRQLVSIAKVDFRVDLVACLAIPAGMLWLAAVLWWIGAIAGRTTGQTRLWAAPGWLLLCVGCIATYSFNGEWPNLVLALGAITAAGVAYKAR